MKTQSFSLNLIPNASNIVDKHSENIIVYWSLVCLLKLGGMKRFMEDNRIRYEDVAQFLGLDVWFDDENELEQILKTFAPKEYIGNVETYAKKFVLACLDGLMRKIEVESFTFSPILDRNISKLADLISFNQVEQDILRFITYIKYYDILDEATRTIGDINSEQLYKSLSLLLSYPIKDIQAAFSPRGRLSRTGIVTIDRYNNNSIRHKIDVPNNGFIDKMMTCDEEDIEAMIKDSVRRCEKSILSLEDYGHIESEVSPIVQYIGKASSQKMSGINILLHGRPGTGKTELVKVIAHNLGLELFEVSYADEDDDPISGAGRLKAYRIAQTILQHKSALLMFDEIEDIFKDEDNNRGFGGRKKTNSKAWLNRILEQNPLPAIWITNNVHVIDDAFIRRFDMVLEIPVPPKSKRKDIIRTHAGELIDDVTLQRIAKHENISPAIVTRAAKVVSLIADENNNSSRMFEALINNTIKAQGWNEIDERNDPSLPDSYDPSYVNTSMDLNKLLEGIRHSQSARICFYGVPGTGKSAFGHYIARELDKPFMLKKGSDLMSMWVGGTEKNIAKAFKEASEEDAVLMFDEVDSFLQDRRHANVSWEVTQVNEMLVQMESYNGIFIATTNLMEGLDQASLRRFDLKLEFGYMKPEQVYNLFTEEAKLMNLSVEESFQKLIQELNYLTPGDFVAVRRQNNFSPILSAEDLYMRLEHEVYMKHETVSKKIGFL